MPISLRTLCLVTAVLCNVQRSLEHEIPRRSFLSRRAIDGTRGRKYFDPNEEGAFDSYGSAGGQYDPYDHVTGYYADEAAGCQVFHVCHDVLVSSFLCPIGSTFSQKLLTCDWWTKVDCSSTNRYLGVNRNNYQIDDDEMIRNAYAMISLQSTEDVTKDGLVDPDSGARIVDYSTLGGRTLGYTPGFRRITDYPAVDATGNDLPSGFEDYPQRNDRQILDYSRYQEKLAKTSSVYQSKFHLEDKGRSPYHASPIIRHDYQGRSAGDNEFQDDYRRPDGFTNRLQASYAPTVPTVTTTTRRLYSPTVPTTYRPSTLAYSKLDLLMDSSDHLYAHSKSPVTPPTIVRQDDDTEDISLSETARHHDDPERSESERKADGARLNFEEKSRTNFRINVTDAIDELFRQQSDKPVVRNDDDGNDESAEVIELKDSVGIVQALNNSRGRIIVQRQDPVIQALKNDRVGLTTLPPSGTSAHGDTVNSTQILKKPDVVVANETGSDGSTEDYEDVVNSTAGGIEDTTYLSSSDDGATPPVTNRRERDDDSSIESTTARATIDTTERIAEKSHEVLDDRSSSKENQTAVDQNSSSTKSVSSFGDEQFSADFGFRTSRPALFLRPPLEGFFINVPEETHYTTLDDAFKRSWDSGVTTTEIPRFSSALSGSSRDESPVYNENIDYTDESLPVTTPSPEVHLADRVIIETSTLIPWLVPSWHDRSNVPVTDVVPPVVDYNDGFGDFVPPDRDANGRVESSRAQGLRNSSETETLNRYNTGFQFTIRDAIRAQAQSEVDTKSPCHSSTSDGRTRHCETSSAVPQVAVSTPSVEQEAISIGTKATTRSSEKPVTPVPDKSSTSVARSSVTVNGNIDVEGSSLKAVTPRGVFQTKRPEENVGETTEATTTSSPLHPIRPGSLKQIEETIDRRNSPYEVSFSVKKDEDLDTTADDFISRLIAQQPTVLGDFEIIKSVEPEDDRITGVPQAPRLPDISHTSAGVSSSVVSSSNTADQPKDSDVSMLNLLQLMAELLKLDRLPRPFSTNVHNAETPRKLDDPNEPPFVTANPLLDHSQGQTTPGNAISRASVFDISNTPADTAEPRTSSTLDRNKQSFVTTSPLLDYSQTPFEKANSKPPAFDMLKINVGNSEPKTPLDLDGSEPLFITTNPLLDQSRARTTFRNANSKAPSFDDTMKTTTNVAFGVSPDVSPRINPDYATKASLSTTNGRGNRPFQKQEILEQLTENFGQPLYGGDSIHRSLIFDLPQVQRSLDFETGLPIKGSERVTEEAGVKLVSSTTRSTTAVTTTSPTTAPTTTTTQGTITTAESERTIVETEFVPSLGFSFDTDEGREEYVEAILGGLIDDHGRNKSSAAQLTHEAPKNETLRPGRHESSEDV
ncbi:PREDICTED: mucin-17-like isoform X2 [Dinoponera quadriceps]|uniref:Mucin-17-like isoform X2 n=1 Tax=Dinoponera quadriceps TaxID=609295 RepID=A0A6P3X7S1_DINQU|nr:PREDICTED: mucin-17-like isoform X2 [Dinoponera quadriceps]